VTQALRAFIVQSTPPLDAKQYAFTFMPNGPLFDIQWDDGDLPLLRDLISAIDSPQVLAHSLSNLLLCLQSLVRVGPPSFAEATLDRLAAWLAAPPKGRDVRQASSGPLSVIQFNDDSLSAIPKALGWLALQLWEKLGDRTAPPIMRWLQNAVLDPQPTAIPIMFNLGTRIALRTDGPTQAELLATCQNLLIQLWSRRSYDDSAQPRLAEALRYLREVLREDASSHPDWKPGSSPKAIDYLVANLPDLLTHFSKSSEADVRAAVAALLASLKKWHTLAEPLEQMLLSLAHDNRARVRFAASGAS